MLTRRAVAIAAVTALAGLAACGSDNNDSTTPDSRSQAAYNDADVTFATSMIPHHRQALQMVDLAEGRTLDPEVRALTEQIDAAQAPEIDTMTGWLKTWGKPVPSGTTTGHDMHDMGGTDGTDGMDGMDGMDTGSEEMPGMMSAEDVAALDKAGDAEFEDMWLRMMVRHHEGAVTMAKAELSDGLYAPARKLAQAIIDGQQAEIDQMNRLLGS